MADAASAGKVVLLEPEEGYRRSLVELLAAVPSAGVLPVGSTNELLTALVAEPPPLCALVNHELPGDGARAAADALWILAPGTPVMFFSGRSDAALDADAFPAPVALLQKPLRGWDITSTLSRLRRRAPATPGPDPLQYL